MSQGNRVFGRKRDEAAPDVVGEGPRPSGGMGQMRRAAGRLGYAGGSALLAPGSGALQCKDGPAEEPGLRPDGVYVVQSGDWMAKIAETHGITLQELMRANPGYGPPARSWDRIYPGEELVIPGGGGPSPGKPNPSKPQPKKPKPQAPPPTITSKTSLSAPDGTADTRTTVAVGEMVTFTGSAPGKWTKSAGKDFGKSVDTNKYWWVAPARAGTATIRLTTGAASGGVSTGTATITVVEPKGIKMTKLREYSDFAAGKQGVGMDLNFTLEPLGVVFDEVKIREISGPASGVAGYYKRLQRRGANLTHAAEPVPAGIDNQNVAENEDVADDRDRPSPWDEGEYKWKIPNHFLVGSESGVGKKFCETLQTVKMHDTTGKTTVTKENVSASRTPSAATTRATSGEDARGIRRLRGVRRPAARDGRGGR